MTVSPFCFQSWFSNSSAVVLIMISVPMSIYEVPIKKESNFGTSRSLLIPPSANHHFSFSSFVCLTKHQDNCAVSWSYIDLAKRLVTSHSCFFAYYCMNWSQLTATTIAPVLCLGKGLNPTPLKSGDRWKGLIIWFCIRNQPDLFYQHWMQFF